MTYLDNAPVSLPSLTGPNTIDLCCAHVVAQGQVEGSSFERADLLDLFDGKLGVRAVGPTIPGLGVPINCYSLSDVLCSGGSFKVVWVDAPTVMAEVGDVVSDWDGSVVDLINDPVRLPSFMFAFLEYFHPSVSICVDEASPGPALVFAPLFHEPGDPGRHRDSKCHNGIDNIICAVEIGGDHGRR